MSLIGLCRPCRRHLVRGLAIRSLSTHETNITDEAAQPPPPPSSNLDPSAVASASTPVGSRRRRAAIQSARNIPFEQLPYQCFQEARKILQEDRQEKLALIEKERGRIQRLKEQQVNGERATQSKETRLRSMREHLEWLKIQADINDPLVKKRFEDGHGDMNRPIYRFLAQRKWSARKKLIFEQRITQMNIVPDIIPALTITADVDLYYPGLKHEASKSVIPHPTHSAHRVAVQPGEFVASKISERPPRLTIQPFDKGPRLVTIAVVDPDIPDLHRDAFDYRCLFLAVNVPISPTQTAVPLALLDAETQLVLPWAAPYAHKGAPYHRCAVLVFRQPEGVNIVPAQARAKVSREGFIMRSFADRYALQPFGAHLFRTQWDEWMEGVMQRAGVPDAAAMEFRFRRIEKLPYKKKDGSRFR